MNKNCKYENNREHMVAYNIEHMREIRDRGERLLNVDLYGICCDSQTRALV
jgi:hypothetical protein